MATSKRDYYEVLGVKREADDVELKRAFRKMARQYHPDVNREPDAELRFKEVGEAYEVLSDPQKRQLYDQYGHAGVHSSGPDFSNFSTFGPFADIFEQFGNIFGEQRGTRRGPQRGADLRYDLPLTFEEAAFGCEKTLDIPRWESCARCGGNGAEPNSELKRCPQCGGSGEVRKVQQSFFGQFVNVSVCSRCQGEGTVVASPCKQCKGEGRIHVTKKLTVKIPAGVDNGQQIRLTGEGEVGPHGGPAGNLFVVLDIKPHPLFRRDGADLHYELQISFPQAALGDTVEVPTIDGPIALTIPAGAPHGKVLRLRDRGVARLRGMGRGDQYVTISVRTPTNLSPRERDLYEELAAVARYGDDLEQAGQHRARILEFLRDHPHGSDDEAVAEALGIRPRQQVQALLRGLEKEGRVTRHPGPNAGKSLYRLAESTDNGSGEHRGFLGKVKGTLGI